jgi:hypothetical protein
MNLQGAGRQPVSVAGIKDHVPAGTHTAKIYVAGGTVSNVDARVVAIALG